MKVRGVVKGKTMVLNENLDFEDGETVEVDIRTIEESPSEEYGIKPNPRSFEGGRCRKTVLLIQMNW